MYGMLRYADPSLLVASQHLVNLQLPKNLVFPLFFSLVNAQKFRKRGEDFIFSPTNLVVNWLGLTMQEKFPSEKSRWNAIFCPAHCQVSRSLNRSHMVEGEGSSRNSHMKKSFITYKVKYLMMFAF